MISENDFLLKYKLTEVDLNNAMISWDNLCSIYNDHSSKVNGYDESLKRFSESLREMPQCKYVHYRTKDPEHLIAKVVRKNKKIYLDNYISNITDLLACKIIYLYRDDWKVIHQFLIKNFKNMFIEEPIANTIHDNKEMFSQLGVKTDIRESKYQSIHYLIGFEGNIIELQVRSIYQEAWGEIDHLLRYPYETDNIALGEFSKLLNEITIVGDKLSNLINDYKERLMNIDRFYLTSDQLTSLKDEFGTNIHSKLLECINSNIKTITIGELIEGL